MVGDSRERVWMHCASLGEFEQARPILEALRKKHPHKSFILTFFSPSGYQVHQKYSGADQVFYLPLDSSDNARKFIQIVKPTLALFVKYDLWYHFLKTLSEQQVPTVLFSALFRKDQIFFKWYGGIHRQMLGYFQQIFVQDNSSKRLLEQIGIHTVQVAGDTRFDRSAQLLLQKSSVLQLIHFKENHKLIIAGSTWLADDRLLQKLLSRLPETFKLLIAPHDIQVERISEIKALFTGKFCFWDSEEELLREKRVCILNTIGELANAYQYADVVWIGGGFTRSGIHNVVEPAVFGKPIFFGPEYKRYREAVDLIASNAAVSSTDIVMLAALFQNEVAVQQMGQQATAYVQKQLGASNIILSYLEEKNF